MNFPSGTEVAKSKSKDQSFRAKDLVLFYTEDFLAFILIRHNAQFRIYLAKDATRSSLIAVLFEKIGITDLEADITISEESLKKLINCLRTSDEIEVKHPPTLDWFKTIRDGSIPLSFCAPGNFSDFAFSHSGHPLNLEIEGTTVKVTMLWGLIFPQEQESHNLVYLISRITDNEQDKLWDVLPSFKYSEGSNWTDVRVTGWINGEKRPDNAIDFKLPVCFSKLIDDCLLDALYFTKGDHLHLITFLEYLQKA